LILEELICDGVIALIEGRSETGESS
jgi:hypothetical protein